MGMAYATPTPVTFLGCTRCNAWASVRSGDEDKWLCNCPKWRTSLDWLQWQPIRLELWWQERLVTFLRRYADWLESR